MKDLSKYLPLETRICRMGSKHLTGGTRTFKRRYRHNEARKEVI